MAAGLGTRLRPFTQQVSKPLIPLMGVPMAQFSLDSLSAAGVRNVVANVHHLPQETEQGLRLLEQSFDKISISDESALLLGSAGGLKKAEPLFEGRPFFAVNADVICSVNLEALARHHSKMRAQYGVSITLAIFERPPNQNAYREIHVDSKSSLITGFGTQVQGRPFYVGCAVIESEALAHTPNGEFSEFVPMILEPAIRAGKAAAFKTSGLWYDVGSPELWLDTHIELMNRLETGDLPALWRRRIERVSRRVSQGIWTSIDVHLPSFWAQFGAKCGGTRLWESPVYYWNEKSLQTARGAKTIQQVGPRAILYSQLPEGVPAQNVITFSGETKVL